MPGVMGPEGVGLAGAWGMAALGESEWRS
jgi:hypothetical protein